MVSIAIVKDAGADERTYPTSGACFYRIVTRASCATIGTAKQGSEKITTNTAAAAEEG